MLKTAGLWLWRISRTLLLFYVIALVALYFFQEMMLFHPGEPLAAALKFEPEDRYQEFRVLVGGEKMHALLVKPSELKPGAPRAPRGLLLYFHGNAGDLAMWKDVGEDIADRFHWNVLIADYPGFGKSEGAVQSEEQLHELGKKMLELASGLRARLPLVLYGRSIGSGIATRLAAENKVDGLVLESPYLSMLSLAGGMFPWVPGFVLRYPLRSDLAMPKVACPALILHGDEDELIPHASGLALSKLPKSGRFVTIEGGHHNDLGQSEIFWAELGAFLGRIGANQAIGRP